MGCKLIFITGVAGQTNLSSYAGIFCCDQATRDVLLMRSIRICMANQPVFSAAMTTLAANTVGYLKFWPALFYSYVVSVAIEANFCSGCVFQSELSGDGSGLR